MGFVPIEIEEHVRLFLKRNQSAKPAEVTARVQRALRDYKTGFRCSCGEPIWVIGSAEAGNACFTCITGDVDPSEDYEIAAACDKWAAPGVARRRDYGEEATEAQLARSEEALPAESKRYRDGKGARFHPDALVRARPDPKQKKWKLPVKEWIHELHLKRFGKVLGEKPSPASPSDKGYDEVAEFWSPTFIRDDRDDRPF